MAKNELPIKVKAARQQLGWGETYTSAVLRRMKLGGARRVFVSDLVKFARKNPLFKISDEYQRKRN